MPFEGGTRGSRIVCLDGTEGLDGRALMLLSVCHLAARRLRSWSLRIIDVDDPDVELAAEALAFDTGLDVHVLGSTAAEDPLRGASLYVALTHRGIAHLRLEEAARAGIPVLAAAQSAECPGRSDMLPTAFGHDTRAFADLLGVSLDRIEKGQEMGVRFVSAMMPEFA
jgi:hypothetical protein